MTTFPLRGVTRRNINNNQQYKYGPTNRCLTAQHRPITYGILVILKHCIWIRSGIESPLTTCGKVLKCLRMTIDYTVRDMAKISMYKYIVKLLTKLPSDMNRVPKMPAPRHLVNVNAEDLEFCLKLKL